MSWLDMVPIVSQVKAAAQALTGDTEGAERTCERYFTKTPIMSHIHAGIAKVTGNDDMAKECWEGANNSTNALPVIGHAKGIGHYAVGDVKGGNQAMKRATSTTLDMANGTPGVGHVKGLVHLALDQEEEGKRAMLAATRTTVVMGAGAAGFVAAGPAGAVVVGMGAGAEWDLGTAIATDGKQINGICKIIDEPKKVDSYLDAGLSLAGDAMTGYSGGKIAERAIRKTEIGAAENLKATRQTKEFPSDKSIAKGSKEVYCEATDTRTGKTHIGVNKTVRKRYGEPAPDSNEFLQRNADVKPALDRHPATCAEAQALHKVVVDPANPDGSTLHTRLTTLEVKPNGDIYNIRRCDNCLQYKDVVGQCPTDKFPTRVPGANEYATRGGAALTTSRALAAREGHRQRD